MSITAGQTALASDFVSAASGAADRGKVAKLNTIGQMEAGFFKQRVVRVYTADATWTKPASLAAVIMEVQAAGAGGGQGTTSNQGGGGSGGTYARGFTTAGVFTASVVLKVGAQGAGHTGSAGSGANATPANFGQFIVCPGGLAGTSTLGGAESAAATGTSVDIYIPGQCGETSGNTSVIARGGNTVLGNGSQGGIGSNAPNATNYGGGGGSGNASSANAGNGGPPVIIITELYTA